jgi:hypothetical protein
VVPLDRDAALRILLREHDRLVRLAIGTIDALEDAQGGRGPRLNMENLRRAAGRSLRESIEARDAALGLLGLDVHEEDQPDGRRG